MGQPTQEFLESRKKQASALVDELVGKFSMSFKFKDEKTQTMIRQQLRTLHDHEDDTVEAGLATVALHHLLLKTPDDYWQKMRTLPEKESKQ